MKQESAPGEPREWRLRIEDCERRLSEVEAAVRSILRADPRESGEGLSGEGSRRSWLIRCFHADCRHSWEAPEWQPVCPRCGRQLTIGQGPSAPPAAPLPGPQDEPERLLDEYGRLVNALGLGSTGPEGERIAAARSALLARLRMGEPAAFAVEADGKLEERTSGYPRCWTHEKDARRFINMTISSQRKPRVVPLYRGTERNADG